MNHPLNQIAKAIPRLTYSEMKSLAEQIRDGIGDSELLLEPLMDALDDWAANWEEIE